MSFLELLSVCGLQKSFPDSEGNVMPVFSGIEFRLRASEVTVLLGPNGCGKSTLLRAIAGIEGVDSGEIFSPVSRPGSEVGYLAQGEELLAWRTLEENIHLPLEVLSYRREVASRKTAELLRTIGLSSFARVYPPAISGGMRQKVLLARLFAAEPRLLLLDEPFAELDLVTREDFGKLLRDYVRAGDRAAIVVTHSPEEAISLADRIFVLSKRPARIIQEFLPVRDENAYRLLPQIIEVVRQANSNEAV